LPLPNWFILLSPPDLNIDVKQWRKLAWERIRLLEQLPQNPSQVINDNFPVYDDALSQIYNNYRLGAYLLRLVAATNRRFEAWLIESEGDLFEHLYHDRTEDIEQKIAIFQDIFGHENVMQYDEYKINMDEENNENLAKLYDEFYTTRGRISRDFLICVHFSQVPWMVSNRKGYLRKGWIISNEVSFRGSLKKAFEKILQKEIEKAQNLLGIREEIDQVVQDIEQKAAKHIQIRSQFTGYDFEGLDLYSHPEIFPPCMIYLFFEFEQSGRLTHMHRLQLGFFLKKIGMSVDEQLHYWFEKSVDNVGTSFTEFQRTSGYQIRHIYGLEGSKKDYDVPKCSTIATSYFCPFVHLAPDILVKFLGNNYLTKIKSKNLTEKQLENIVTLSSRNPTQACSSYFFLIFGRSNYRKIVHPLQWARNATKLQGLMKEQSNGESIENMESGESQ
jgi:DNA primase large subunit